ncbi:MAG TPA: trehalose-phosphatase [Acidimicrobiales bacterium]|nr:trehalose-phosphatase [Acidimicrobiales bacterium]
MTTGVPDSLAPMLERPGATALFLDYDGTLAPIVEDPAAARPLPGVSELLPHLARRFGLVAVVSGRPVGFLAEVLGRPVGVHLVGLYGLEGLGPDGTAQARPAVERWRPVVADVTRSAQEGAPTGLGVEPKGLTVTLHWRAAPDAEAWARRFAAAAAGRTGLVLQSGRMAVELRPPVDVDKGTEVRRLGAGFAAVACFGDDLGDLPAFDALSDLAAAGAAVARVAVADPETAPEVVAAADVVVHGPAGALALLGRLAGDES